MTSKKISYSLIAFAALAQGVMWINVFKMLHHDYWAYIGGIPSGIAVVGMVAFGANQLPRVGSKRARHAGWVLLIIVMLVEPIVLGFANYIAMEPKSYVVAGGASLVVSLALVLGAIVERSLIPAQASFKKPQAKQERNKRTAKKPLKVPCEWCGKMITDSQNARNAHAAYCKVLQEASKHD